jgi:hypothetical protein
MLMTKIRIAALALATVGFVGVGVAAGGRDDPPKPAADTPKNLSSRADAVVEVDPQGTAHFYGPAQFTTKGPMERVEAYKIGDDLFLNVAPPGSGRLLLEKVTGAGRAPAEQKVVDPTRPRPAATSPVPATAARRTPLPAAAAPTRRPAATSSRIVPDLFKATDDLAAHLRRVPSPDGVDGATFIRRAYLDTLGRVPTPKETEEFLSDRSSDKRTTLVERLVNSPEFVEHARATTRALLAPAKPVSFTLEGATLDRVDVENGNLIDIRLDNGLDYPPTARASAHRVVADDGSVRVGPPATRVQAIPVAVDARIEVESEGRVVTTGVGEAILKSLKPGMQLTLELSAEGRGLYVRGIKARQAGGSRGDRIGPDFPFSPKNVTPADQPSRR